MHVSTFCQSHYRRAATAPGGAAAHAEDDRTKTYANNIAISILYITPKFLKLYRIYSFAIHSLIFGHREKTYDMHISL